MRDFKKDSSAQKNLSRFGRDSRVRSSSSDAGRSRGGEERRPRSQRDAADSDFRSERPARSTERRSYNPNFSRDNRPTAPAFSSSERGEREERKPYGEKKQFGDRKPYGNRERKPYGEKKQYGDRKPYGDRKQYPRRNDDDKTSYPKYDPNRQTGEMRLNRYLAQSGLCSRREADDYIAAGVVTVNGNIVTELGTKVLATDEVKFNDSRIQGEKKVYLVLNKPKGYVTSNDDPHADKLVMDLVRDLCTERIYPVGRLDKNSLGLLLFTNDGDLTKQLTHPSHKKKKIYQVSLNKPLTRADMDSLAEGIKLEDGEIYADEISYVKDDKTEVGIEIHSGRNRIVRRMFEHLGYTVQKLDRVYYAGLTKKNLKRGQSRFLTKDEVERLKSGRYE
ncbi:MAG: pseudouridine synthase [Rikenellaceae bacterium]